MKGIRRGEELRRGEERRGFEGGGGGGAGVRRVMRKGEGVEVEEE